MAHELPELPYAYNALEPYIDEQTMRVHHDKHHATYLAKFKDAIGNHAELHNKSVEEILANLTTLPDSIRTAVRNHGGGYYHHNVFWTNLSPQGGGEPTGAVAEAIKKTFGGFPAFKEKLTAAATGVFGSGWAWLCVDRSKNLSIVQTPNQDCPLTQGLTPVLALDVWEHAYYLKYQNRRPDYITAWWNVVNWKDVNDRYTKAK